MTARARRSRLDPHDGGPCDCDWSVPTSTAMLAHRTFPQPDQSRYGRATTDPLGRDTPKETTDA